MFFKLLTLSALFIYCSSSQTINETVSEQNVTKREANVGDLFPDWVPFKNKHGDELGDFVQVQKKSKVKKRLAPPVNFILRAVAEEGEEYYDKGAGESDSDDYFEKKDWSDLHRPVQESDKKKAPLNHTDISDIDGVVEIIKKGPPEPIAAALESAKKEIDEKRKQRQKALESEIIEGDDDVKSTEATDGKKARASEEDGEDYDEENTEKPKPSSAEIKESEAKKAKILSSVDELKERHAEEQRHINDRLKEEDLYKDQHRGKVFEGSFEERDRPERRPRLKNRKPTTKPDYDEYEDLNGSLEDKYKINILKTVSPAEPKEKIKITKETTTSLPRVSKLVQSGKLSVFKNPSLYMVLDDEDEPTSTPSSTAVYTRGTQKFSSRFTTTPATNTEDDRISLVPVESKEGEPTLFFPKRRKNRRKTIRMTTPSEIDSSVAETVTDNYKQTTAFDTTASDTVQSDTTAPESSSESTTETLTTASDFGTDFASADTVTDAVPASSDHKKEKEKHTDYHNRRGGGREHHSEHSEEHEEHGKKAYEGYHEDTKTAKGHHDKENHLGKYDDKGGIHKHHSEEAGHYGDHHHEEHGKKHAKYEESGKHSKGHSTKGSHDIHKKEEYEKNVEFFEEEGDSGEEEKHGGYNHEKEHSEGGHFKHGKLQANHEAQAKGESGHFAKGGHGHLNKGHKQANGHDSHGKHAHKHFQKEGKDGGRKWIYHQGHPAKTANLVVIDRRGDQYYHGPHYYG